MDNSRGKTLPGSVRTRFGQGRVEKGRWGQDENSVFLVAWDFVEECEGEDCPIYDICTYKDSFYMKKGVNGGSGKCLMQQRYLKNVLHAIMEKITNKGEMNQENVIKLGYHLLPLYNQLFKFKVVEYTVDKMVYVSDKGNPQIHPVYKEIREIIKTLSGMWKDIGGDPKKKPDMKNVGDSSFIDAMFQDQNNAPIGDNGEGEKGTGLDYSQFEDSENGVEEEGCGIDHADDKGRPRKRSQKRGYKRPRKPKKRGRPKKPEKPKVPGYCQTKKPMRYRTEEDE